MPHPRRTPLFTVMVGAACLALALATAGPAAAQTSLRIPAVTAWGELPDVAPDGTPVLVKTRDGTTVTGRVSGLSDTAIVLDGGRIRTIPAASVDSIESGRGPRPVWKGAETGARIGLFFVMLELAAQGEGSPENLASTGFCAGIGAGIGALIPGKRTLLYAAPVSNWASLGLAPDAGRGRRGVAVLVAF